MQYQTCKFKDTSGGRKSRGVSLASRALDQPWETVVKFTSPQDSYPHLLGVSLSFYVLIKAPEAVLLLLGHPEDDAKKSGARNDNNMGYGFLAFNTYVIWIILLELFTVFMLWKQHYWNVFKTQSEKEGGVKKVAFKSTDISSVTANSTCYTYQIRQRSKFNLAKKSILKTNKQRRNTLFFPFRIVFSRVTSVSCTFTLTLYWVMIPFGCCGFLQTIFMYVASTSVGCKSDTAPGTKYSRRNLIFLNIRHYYRLFHHCVYLIKFHILTF